MRLRIAGRGSYAGHRAVRIDVLLVFASADCFDGFGVHVSGIFGACGLGSPTESVFPERALDGGTELDFMPGTATTIDAFCSDGFCRGGGFFHVASFFYLSVNHRDSGKSMPQSS